MTKAVVTLTRSPINHPDDQEKTLRALGLRKLGDKREFDYSRSVRGMLMKVRHMVTVELREEAPAAEGEK